MEIDLPPSSPLPVTTFASKVLQDRIQLRGGSCEKPAEPAEDTEERRRARRLLMERIASFPTQTGSQGTQSDSSFLSEGLPECDKEHLNKVEREEERARDILVSSWCTRLKSFDAALLHIIEADLLRRQEEERMHISISGLWGAVGLGWIANLYHHYFTCVVPATRRRRKPSLRDRMVSVMTGLVAAAVLALLFLLCCSYAFEMELAVKVLQALRIPVATPDQSRELAARLRGVVLASPYYVSLCDSASLIKEVFFDQHNRPDG
eukprot:Sspe_Gene.74155::Locus_45641_Transcript_1_1_Confidence_1.000_Length_1029::g.74155::m.74155